MRGRYPCMLQQSSWLRDALSELDPSCDKLTIISNPSPPTGRAPRSTASKPIFRIQAAGTFGSTEVSVNYSAAIRLFIVALTKIRWIIPMTEMFWRRLNVQDRSASGRTSKSFPMNWFNVHTTSYRFGHISRALRALQSSMKTSLRIDDEGLLSLQFLMPSPKPRGGSSEAFIEFRVSLLKYCFIPNITNVYQSLALDDSL